MTTSAADDRSEDEGEGVCAEINVGDEVEVGVDIGVAGSPVVEEDAAIEDVVDERKDTDGKSEDTAEDKAE